MTDVLIIGDGPAGLAAAITLRQKGRAVTVAYRKKEQAENRVGESLTSSALVALQHLDVLDAFINDNHQSCHGNCSCWGSENLAFFDFIQSAAGNGWYIDRARFNQMLLTSAATLGVKFIEAERTATLVKDTEDNWNLRNGDDPVSAKLIIDASGRNNWLGRQLGIQRIEEDQQIAVMNIFYTQQPVKSAHSMVEAVEDGWWYVAEPSDGTMVVIFFTDPDLHNRSDLSDPHYLQKKMDHTRFVKHRVNAQIHTSADLPIIMAAGSSSLSSYSGPGWFATGDAAFSIDPLSSHGIALALRSGIDAGIAADLTLAGSVTATDEYNALLHSAVSICREQRSQIYSKETRWEGDKYWQRRKKLLVHDPISA